jgi:hypothetical protein
VHPETSRLNLYQEWTEESAVGVERMHSPKWLMRAEEFHTKADNCQFPDTKAALRQVAKNYEDLARQARQILDAEQSIQRRRLEARGESQEYLEDQRAIVSSCVTGWTKAAWVERLA